MLKYRQNRSDFVLSVRSKVDGIQKKYPRYLKIIMLSVCIRRNEFLDAYLMTETSCWYYRSL